MSEWRQIWPNGLPTKGRSPKSNHRLAAEKTPFPRRWYEGMISADLEVIWAMSGQMGNVGSIRWLEAQTCSIWKTALSGVNVHR